MKRNVPYPARQRRLPHGTRLMTTLMALMAVLACGEMPLGTVESDEIAFKQGNGKGGGGGPGEVTGTPLQIVFRDGAGDAIRSDGSGPYEHDIDEVRALIADSTAPIPGQFQFRADTDESTPGRALSISLPGVFDGSVDAKILTPDAFLQSTRLGVSWVSEGYSYRLRYGFDCAGNNTGGGITVELVAEQTYEVTDQGGAWACKQALRGKPDVEQFGPLSAPFLMTVTETGG